MIRPRMGLVKRLPKLMVVGDQRVVLLQQLSDLGLRRSYEMINGLAVISFARHRESGRPPNAGHLLGLCSRRLLTRQKCRYPESSQGNGTRSLGPAVSQ